MRISSMFLAALAVAMVPGVARAAEPASCAGANALTAAEKAAGWTLLFDGRSTAGWHGYNGQSIEAWAIEDCALKTTGTEGNYGSDKRADLVSDALYTNFEISIDWKASKGGNSGSCTASSRTRSTTRPGRRARLPVHRRRRLPAAARAVAEGGRQLRDAPAERPRRP